MQTQAVRNIQASYNVNIDNGKIIASSNNTVYVIVDDSGVKGQDRDLFGNYLTRFIDPVLEKKRLPQLIGTPVTIEHNPREVVGKVKDAFYNTNGFTTETGAFISPTEFGFGIVAIEIFTDKISMEDVLAFKGSSTEMRNVQYDKGQKMKTADSLPIDYYVLDFTYTGITFTNSPRSTKSNVILNSNNNLFLSNMDEQQLKKLFMQFQQEMEDAKAMQTKEQEKEEYLNSVKNSIEELNGYKNSTSETITSLQNSINEMKEKIDNMCSTKNSEEETMKEEPIQNSDESMKEEDSKKKDAEEEKGDSLNNSVHTDDNIIRFKF